LENKFSVFIPVFVPFQPQLKRPYFHVKPLEKGQLKTWREYLDFEIQGGDRERTRVLFERCFIACALYEEFWLKVPLTSILKGILIL
jgi:hypothetical protein